MTCTECGKVKKQPVATAVRALHAEATRSEGEPASEPEPELIDLTITVGGQFPEYHPPHVCKCDYCAVPAVHLQDVTKLRGVPLEHAAIFRGHDI